MRRVGESGRCEMQVFTYSEARQELAKVLEQAVFMILLFFCSLSYTQNYIIGCVCE